ncbi:MULTISPECIES: phycobilisome protein [unclassified Okeania]|uniref:phycobilisome protein n=1 Tax=unclassified Okeania TaxID=2634635 RepID=UPI00257E2F95|nr:MULTISPECIES: phycobilisome protein [unclassified Okeania]
MSETIEANTSTPKVQEIEEVITGLEQLKERIVNDTIETAKKVKMPKAKVMAKLEQHPELSFIDKTLKELRLQQPTPLTEAAKQLIPKARIVSFKTWEEVLPTEVIQLFQMADDEGRYLTDDDLQVLKKSEKIPTFSLEAASLLRDCAAEIVDEAREKVLAKYPNITAEGGDLYPPARAEACWRDFWHFLRCITYGIAGDRTDFTSAEGLHYMNLLYQELLVPLSAMVLGLEAIKTASLKRFSEEKQAELAPYFDHLVSKLQQFSTC